MEALENGKQVGRVSGLLLTDSGFAPLNTPEWIANLQPQVVVLSVSPKDATGLPSPETLEAVEGYTLLRTDRNGWIELTTDGEQMWVEVERKLQH
jgi:beta-lactamase superfamily II metal-dependent hydrolase